MKRSNQASSVKALYDDLSSQGFPKKKLSQLDDTRYFEDTLWPIYDKLSDLESSILICFLFTEKKSKGLPTFEGLEALESPGEADSIEHLLKQVLHAVLDRGLSFNIRSTCLCFMIDAASNLDKSAVQRAFQPLVSILIWRNLIPALREELFESRPLLRKRYKARLKALNIAKEEAKSVLLFSSDFLSSLIIELIYQMNTHRGDSDTMIYCARVVEFLCVMLSQLPTRRYTIYVINDLQVLCQLRHSYRYNTKPNPGLIEIKAHCEILEYYLSLSYDSIDGREYTAEEALRNTSASILNLQQIAITDFKDKLLLLALSNHATIYNPAEMRLHLDSLDEKDLVELCTKLHVRTLYESSELPPVKSDLLKSFLIQKYAKVDLPADRISAQSLFPNEATLFSDKWNLMARMNDHLPLPKLSLQFLSTQDFAYRLFDINRASVFLSTRADIVSGLTKLSPQISYPTRKNRYNGSSNHFLLVDPPVILDVSPPRIESPGSPRAVRAELRLDLANLAVHSKKGWKQLQEGDLIYLMHLAASDSTANGLPDPQDPEFAEKIGLKCVRTATIESILTIDGKPLHLLNKDATRTLEAREDRLLRILLDPIAFQADKDAVKLEEVYENLNLVMKRRSTKNNVLSVMQGLQKYVRQSHESLPDFFENAFLGLGDDTRKDEITTVCLNDTFVDMDHVKEVLPKASLPSTEADGTPKTESQNYGKLTNADLKVMLAERNLSLSGKKADFVKRLLESDNLASNSGSSSPNTSEWSVTLQHVQDTSGEADPRNYTDGSSCTVTFVQLSPQGPYVSNIRRKNAVRFTASQVAAIRAATSPGLSVIDAGPGTGKSLVTAQIINNVYHNETDGRQLVICKTEKGIDAIVSHLRALNVRQEHILTLRGSPYEMDASQHAHAVEIVLARRHYLLQKVSSLAIAFDAPGDHGASCELAAYFYETIVCRKLQAMSESGNAGNMMPWQQVLQDGKETLREEEFDHYESSKALVESIFAELAELRPLELLKSTKMQLEYLLTKLAKIVFMTTEYSICAQTELQAKSLTFTSILYSQAAAIGELEAFVPFAVLERASVIKRLVFVGDSNQIGFRSATTAAVTLSTNANQTLFSRLRRSGATTFSFEYQGRARSSFTKVWQHRYSHLQSMAHTARGPFLQANAGMCHTLQFINVTDYKGAGEYAPRQDAWQNLGEAEYLVALYQYLRLLNYPRERIAILTPFADQKALLQDVLNARCKDERILGIPVLATIGEYQGCENDYVLLSLVRTTPNHDLQDLGMITTALSRAKLGLYVFGRRSAMPAILEPFLGPLDMTANNKLELVTGEMHPTDRQETAAAVDPTVMESVEHLGQYVYEMTQKKLESLAN